MKTIYIYTDGACSGNPGPGGWAAILRYKGHEKELCGGEKMTTNNRMEMTALLAALQTLKEPCHVILTSDSKYVLDTLEKGWAAAWKNKGWKRSGGHPALNRDLWESLLREAERHTLEYHWIPGHTGHSENERCDAMATAQAALQKG